MDVKELLERETNRILAENGQLWMVVMAEFDKRLAAVEDAVAQGLAEEAIKVETLPAVPTVDASLASEETEAAPVSEPEETTLPWQERQPEETDKKPNGYKCLYCQADLYGGKRKWCSKDHANRYGYLKSRFPSASHGEITRIIAGSGVLDRRRKNGKAKRAYAPYSKVAEELGVEASTQA